MPHENGTSSLSPVIARFLHHLLLHHCTALKTYLVTEASVSVVRRLTRSLSPVFGFLSFLFPVTPCDPLDCADSR